MKLQLAVLFVVALTAQVVISTWHGFDPVEDGLQLASAGTLSLLILRLHRIRSRRRKTLIVDAVRRNAELAEWQGSVATGRV